MLGVISESWRRLALHSPSKALAAHTHAAWRRFLDTLLASTHYCHGCGDGNGARLDGTSPLPLSEDERDGPVSSSERLGTIFIFDIAAGMTFVNATPPRWRPSGGRNDAPPIDGLTRRQRAQYGLEAAAGLIASLDKYSSYRCYWRS